MNYKNKVVSFTVSMAMVMQFVLPTMSYAQNGGTTSDNFCSRIETVFSQIDQRMASRQAKLAQINSQRQSNLAANRNRVDTELAKKRSDWSSNRAKQYAALESRAKTPEQVEAVGIFKASIEEAIATRKTAVDAAMSAFRSSLDQNIITRNTAITAAITNFTNKTNAAQDKAKADCAAKVKILTIAKNYRTSMVSARTEYLNALRAIEKINAVNLLAIRRQAINKAISDFLAASEKARIALKAAFGEEK